MLTKKYSDSQTFTNEYDEKGRISSSSYGETTVNYAYDTHGQLVSANDDTYDYDDRGNITSKTVGNTTTTFTYNTDGWKDLLVKINDDKLTYDANGNVLTYGDKEFTWSYGRTLTGITDGENKYSYTYDENGIRTSKTVNGVTTYYNTDNGVILSQSDGDNTWYFQYDTNGSPLGFVLNGIQYFYITNQMGDILAITDTDGNVIGNYEYDAWGKVLTADTDIAKQNPLRYRGYYYDNETGYYYLQSRYYDADICRFINADMMGITLISTKSATNVNLFVYCSNIPVNNCDPTGYIALTTCVLIGVGIGALIGAVCGAGIAISKGYTVKNGIKFWKYVLGGITIGGVVGGILGYVGGALFGASGVKAGTLASKISMSKVRRVGKLGEKLAKISKNKTHIKSLNKTAAYRIPDILSYEHKVIGDVKYVKYLSYTKQLQDYYAYAVKMGYIFILYIRPETKLSSTLQNMVDAGKIFVFYITKK